MKSSVSKKKILIVIIGLLFVLSLNFFQKEVRGFFYSVSEPIQKSLWEKGSKASSFFGAIFEAKSLKKENEELNLRVQELLASENRLKELEEENKTLREALGLGLQKEFKLEMAEIIGKDTNKDSFLIDKGSKDGISKGLPVITSQKVLVGVIWQVYDDYSRVLLISDKESSLVAQVSGSNVSGLIKGLGNFKILFDLIPKDSRIKEGDLVISRGFLVGLVGEVKEIDVNPFRQAEIVPLFIDSGLSKVFIAVDF